MNIPYHVAVIPDGNRRWAREHHLPDSLGHEKGAAALRDVLDAALDLGITYFSFWGASISNLTMRSQEEVQFLQKLYEIQFKILAEERGIHENKVKVSVFGQWEELLREEAKNSIRIAIKATEKYNRFFFNFFIGYDGKVEMLNAIKRIVEKIRENPELRITPELVKENLFTHELPPVDLIIRTGGEPHLSAGFMMWDIADSQLYFTQKYWPQFTRGDLKEAIKDFQKRERRFGR